MTDIVVIDASKCHSSRHVLGIDELYMSVGSNQIAPTESGVWPCPRGAVCRCPLRSCTKSSTRKRAQSWTINAACVPDGGVLVADASPLHAGSSHDAPVLRPQRVREGPPVAAATARCATGFMLKAPQCPGDGSWTLSPWDLAMSHRVPRWARRAHTQNTNARTL